MIYPSATSNAIINANPTMTPQAHKNADLSVFDSGNKSSATTNTIAPAAKESNHGCKICKYAAKK